MRLILNRSFPGFVLVVAMALSFLGFGCVSTTETATGPYVNQNGGNTSTIRPPRSPNRQNLVLPADGPETCDEQLQDISDALLNYYARKRQLPEKLEDLRPFAIEGRTLRFTCPDSGKPYIYDRSGPTLNQSMWLTTPTGQPVQMNGGTASGQLVIYDAEAVHAGQRWCIVFGRDTRGSGMRADPCKIPENVLAQALGAAHATPPEK